MTTPPSGDRLDSLLRQGKRRESLEQAQAMVRLKAKLLGGRSTSSLARYELRHELGRGGNSVVFAAYDPELQRDVAIKLIRSTPYGGTGERNSASRLRREAQALAKLSHPNVIAVHDVGDLDEEVDSEDAGVFVVMELVTGRDLAQWLREARRPWSEVVDVFAAAGRGLAAAHAAGLVHRDFKPANVVIGDDGEVRVVDFGLAATGPQARELLDAEPREPPESSESENDAWSRLTVTGSWLGTPAYMAPEQHAPQAGRSADARSDQFAFCASLYEALYGVAAFSGESIEELYEAKQKRQYNVPANPPRVPVWLRRAIAKGLDPDPSKRHPNMQALLRALARGRAIRKRLAVIGLAAVAATLGGGLSLWHVGDGTSCTELERELTGVWDDARRGQVRAALMQSDVPYAEATALGVDERIEAYARGWLRTRKDLCEAASAPDTDADATGRGLVCLAQLHRRLDAQVDVLVQADATITEHAVAAVASLEDASACSDPHRPATPLELASTPESARDLELARAKALANAGKFDAAGAQAQTILKAARAEADPVLQGRALMVVGEVHGWNNDFEAAHAAFREALWMAERAGDDPTAVRALIMLVLVVGNHLERFEEADMLVEHARARLDRLLPGPRWSADLEHYAGLVRYAAEDYQGAIAAYRRALALRESLGTDHPDVAETHLSLGAAYLSQERFTPAQSHLEQALATYREAFGATHPVVGHCLGNLGYLAKAQDQHERALELQQQALSIHRAAVGDVHNWIGRSMLNLGDTLAALGRPTEARLHWEEAAEIHEQLGLATRAAESWTRIATQAEGEGKPDDAREAWERARQILTGLEDASVQQGEVAFALAQLLWPTNPVQATALASEASAAFETGGDPLRARAVTTWLSQR